MAALVDISLDISDLPDLLEGLTVLDPQTLAEMQVTTVNWVALTVNKNATDATVKDLNLTRDYVEARIKREEAKRGGKATAYVRSAVRGTTMQQFGGGMTLRQKPVRWSNRKILTIAKKDAFVNGQVRGPQGRLKNGRVSTMWDERTGDASLGRNIAPDMKANGLLVAVKPGSPRLVDHAFWLPLNRGKEKGGNGFGMFARSKDGTLKHRYGPSVYQTFRRYAQENEVEISNMLRDEFNAALDTKLTEFNRR